MCPIVLSSPNGTIYNGVALGDWIAAQINASRDGSLLPYRRNLLENAGYKDTFLQIEIEAQRQKEMESKRLKKIQDEEWNQMFRALVQYQATVGTCFW